MATKLEGHPVHLPDGSWGVKIEGDGASAVKPGDKVGVKSKGGKVWTRTVKAIAYTDGWGVGVSTLGKGETLPSAPAAAPAAGSSKAPDSPPA